MNLAHECADRLKRTEETGQRQVLPSQKELQSIIDGTSLTADVHLMNGEISAVEVDSATSIGEIEQLLIKQINIKNTEGFFLFEIA